MILDKTLLVLQYSSILLATIDVKSLYELVSNEIIPL